MGARAITFQLQSTQRSGLTLRTRTRGFPCDLGESLGLPGPGSPGEEEELGDGSGLSRRRPLPAVTFPTAGDLPHCLSHSLLAWRWKRSRAHLGNPSWAQATLAW